jgi:hypothetical protein
MFFWGEWSQLLGSAKVKWRQQKKKKKENLSIPPSPPLKSITRQSGSSLTRFRLFQIVK